MVELYGGRGFQLNGGDLFFAKTQCTKANFPCRITNIFDTAQRCNLGFCQTSMMEFFEKIVYTKLFTQRKLSNEPTNFDIHSDNWF